MTDVRSRPRPRLLEVLPPRVRQSLLFRYYRPRRDEWPSLYMRARLRHAPDLFLLDLVPGDLIADSIAFTGSFEDDLSSHLLARGRCGGLFVDVGANIGYMSLVWAGANAANRVLALEASPRVFPMLQRNVQANGLERRVRALQVAAGREAGRLAFDLGPPDQTGWGGLAAPGAGQPCVVDVESLDRLLDAEPRIDVLKIDVEGADAWVLEGADRLLRERRIAEIWYEENPVRMRSLGIAPGAPAALLEERGYRATRVSGGRDGLSGWRAQPA